MVSFSTSLRTAKVRCPARESAPSRMMSGTWSSSFAPCRRNDSDCFSDKMKQALPARSEGLCISADRKLQLCFRELFDLRNLRFTQAEGCGWEHSVNLVGPASAYNGRRNCGMPQRPCNRNHTGLHIVRFADLTQQFNQLQIFRKFRLNEV